MAETAPAPAHKDEGPSSGSLLRARLGVAWSLLPKLPHLVRTAVLHLLRLSEASRYLDLRSDLTVALLRSLMDRSQPRPVGKMQAMTLLDPGVKGRLWVSTAASAVPPPEETGTGTGGVRDALLAAIAALGDGDDVMRTAAGFAVPDVVPVEAEWTGHRAGAARDARPPPSLSEAAKYRELLRECAAPTVVLYFHGGAYYMCDPATHRPLTRRLARRTAGRVYSVRYRLAPQHPFPAALLDALVSYLTLLYPPPGAFHAAVAPEHVVFAGDSAGGNLALALLQTVQELRRQGRAVAWFGAARPVPLPAGAAVNSPWLDLTQSLGSWRANARWDYLPATRMLAAPPPPADHLWPADPARRHLYVADALLLHPLASLHLARPGAWRGCCPVYLCCGWECLADEDRFLARRLADEGVPVVLEQFQAMPHVFALLLPGLPEARRCLDGWAGFVREVTGEKTGGVESRFTAIQAKTLKEEDIVPEKLSHYSEAQVRELAEEAVAQKPMTETVPAKL
ncbi:alpha/beta hydrolase fold-domain-containing protein [Xylariomycetidae sp. FL0641]|nr:alpha/beta hydrolase fold-domain-containing protein [Xylariomycetidae sp. FL0641]